MPDEDAEYNMYEATAQILREYGLSSMRFPINAKKGRECRHNVVIGSDRIIWGLAWELPLFMERNVLPIHRI